MSVIIKELDVHLHGPLRPSLRPEQREFMDVCLECLLEGKNGMLESPMSGRTAALLCTSLSWLLHSSNGGLIKHVLYLCGSEQELFIAIEEFNKSYYASKGIHMMKMNCPKDLKEYFAQLIHADNDIDIKKNVTVPTIVFSTQELFFRELSCTIFTPSNYDFQTTAVLIDDAFRVEEACCLTSSLSLCKVDHLIKQLQNSKDSAEITGILKKLEGLKKVFRCIIPHSGSWYDPVYAGTEIIEVFQQCGASFKESDYVFLKDQNLDPQELHHFMSLVEFLTCLNIKPEKSLVASELIDNNFKAFNMYVTESSAKTRTLKNHSEMCQASCKTLNFVCLNSSIMFKILTEKKPYSILLSSATISPLGDLKTVLGCLDAREFIGKCSIEDYQIFARIVQCGSGGQYFESTNRKSLDPDYQTSVGKTILNVAKVTPAGLGMTIYFSSDDMFKQFKKSWKNESIEQQSCFWKLIGQEKHIVLSANNDDLQQFNTDIGHKKGDCIFAVLHEEELDKLVNHSVNLDCHRVVMIIGLPYPPEDNPKVVLKMKYNEEVSRDQASSFNKSGLTGEQFIRREAYKYVRKIVDRSVRSAYDYGVIFLCDCQYDISKLSPWVKNKVLPEKRFAEMLHEMHDFFSNIQKRIQWIMAKAENNEHSYDQFGNVRTWEIEKVRIEFSKLKKNNNGLEKYLERLRTTIKDQEATKEQLEKKLKELSVVKTHKKPECPGVQSEGDEAGSSLQAGVLSAQVTPMKSVLTPTKWADCSATQSEPDEVGDRGTLQRVSPKLTSSPRKRPYPENF